MPYFPPSSDTWINVVTEGADPTGVAAADTVFANAKTKAVATGRPILIPPGTYKTTAQLDWSGDGLTVQGVGALASMIQQSTANTPIIKLGGQNQTITGIGAKYATQQPSTNTAANCFEYNTSYFSRFADLYAALGARGHFIPAVGTNYVFSCHYDTLRVHGYSISAIDFTATSSYITGCVMNNIYTHNNYSGTAVANTGPVFKIAFADEMVINQLNLEWTNPSVWTMLLQQAKNTVINGCHFEGLTPSGFGYGLIDLYDATKLLISGLSFAHNVIGDSLGSRAAFRIGGGNCYLGVRGLNTNLNTISSTGTTHPLIEFSDSMTEGSSYLTECETAEFTSLVVNDSVATPSIKQINDTRYFDNPVANRQVPTKIVRAASTGNVTVTAPGATLDGVTLATSDRVLLKDQTNPVENGLYNWNGAAVALTRTTDGGTSFLSDGTIFEIGQGTVNRETMWAVTSDDPIVIGTTGLRMGRWAPQYDSPLLSPWDVGATQTARPTLAQNMRRDDAAASIAQTAISATTSFHAGMVVPSNRTISNINVFCTAAGAGTVTTFWLAILRAYDRVVLQRTANSTALPTLNAVHTRALQAAITLDTDTPVYIAIATQVATTSPAFAGQNLSTATQNFVAPIWAGNSATSPTSTPPAVGATLNAPTAGNTGRIWAWLT